MPGSSPRKSSSKRLCPHCQAWFRPDPRNRHHQVFCAQPACRQQSKALSQRRWLQKPHNADYFRGPQHVERVRQWRKKHPDCRRKKAPPKATSATPPAPDAHEQLVLQDLCQAQVSDPEALAHTAPTDVCPGLQDLFGSLSGLQSTVWVGLLATLSGSALQDDIATFTRALLRRGRDILGPNSGVPSSANPAPTHDQTAPLSAALAPRAAPV